LASIQRHGIFTAEPRTDVVSIEPIVDNTVECTLVVNTEITIRRFTREDAKDVARLHAEGIPQGFLSRLGSGVRSAMYRGIASAPESGVWVAANADNEVVGFISGTTSTRTCYRSAISRQGVAMAYHALPALVRLSTWRQIIETLSYPKRDKRSSTESSPEHDFAELLSIVVGEGARGTGAALELSRTLECALQQWGYAGIYRVVTMAADQRSNAFYRKIGFEKAGEFTHHGVAMNLYHKRLQA